jgi:hypothetical protein
MAVHRYPTDNPTKAPAGYSSSKSNKPVVAYTPKPISAGYSVQQNQRNAEMNASMLPFVSGAELEKAAQIESEANANGVLSGLGSGIGEAFNGYNFGGSGSGSGTSATSTEKLARDKYERENAIAIEKLRQLQEKYNQGSYNEPYDALLGLLQRQNTSSTQSIQDTYDTGVRNIGQGYDTAQGMVNTGYGALDEYLKQNPNNPYSGYQSNFTPSQNAMQQYMSAYGVDQSPVGQQVAAENISGQLGSDAFQSLNDVLSRVAQQSDMSRLAESQMGRNYATTSLGAQRAGYESNAAQQQQQSLNELLAAINSGEFDIAKSRGAAKSDAKQAIIDATVPQADNPENAATAAAATKSPAVTELLGQVSNATNKTLVKRVEAFAANNPEATKAQVAKQFPSLSKAKKK